MLLTTVISPRHQNNGSSAGTTTGSLFCCVIYQYTMIYIAGFTQFSGLQFQLFPKLVRVSCAVKHQTQIEQLKPRDCLHTLNTFFGALSFYNIVVLNAILTSSF